MSVSVLRMKKRMEKVKSSTSLKSNTIEYLLWIDVGRGFIQHKNSIFSQNGSSQTQQLPLAHTEVASVCQYLQMQSMHSGRYMFQFDFFECRPYLVVWILFKRIQIPANETLSLNEMPMCIWVIRYALTFLNCRKTEPDLVE